VCTGLVCSFQRRTMSAKRYKCDRSVCSQCDLLRTLLSNTQFHANPRLRSATIEYDLKHYTSRLAFYSIQINRALHLCIPFLVTGMAALSFSFRARSWHGKSILLKRHAVIMGIYDIYSNVAKPQHHAIIYKNCTRCVA